MLCRKSKPQLMPGVPFRAAGMMSFPLICHAPPNFSFFFFLNRVTAGSFLTWTGWEAASPQILHMMLYLPEDIITEAKISVIVPFL